MPTRAEFSERRTQWKAEVVRRLTTGESLTAVCAADGMPDKCSVYRWVAKDTSFADAFVQAQQRGTWRRRFAFDDARARVFLRRLASGEPLQSILRDPAMPRLSTLRDWRAQQGEFGAEYAHLIRVYKRQRLEAWRRRVQWNAALADRVLAMVGRGHSYRKLHVIDPSLPGRWVIDRWRRERPDFNADLKVNMAAGRRGRVPARIAAALDRLCAGIVQGGSFSSLGGRDGLPTKVTLYKWAARSPDFARDIAQACDQREDWYTDQLQMIADGAAALGPAEVRRRSAPILRQLGRLTKRPGKKWLE
ncbi:MAG: hypothetical protein ACREE0_08880 [Phenylobacterium sp.]